MKFKTTEEWRKDCYCIGTSSNAQFRSRETGRGEDYINHSVYYYPGPSCDVCGKPWVKIAKPSPA